jgi:thiol-disulfide isomerase/thioredoxin
MKKLFSTLVLLALAPFFPVLAHSAIFPDVLENDPYHASIQALQERGVMKGGPDGLFGPNRILNRAELTAIVVRAGGIQPRSQDMNCFPDVSNEWFAGSICAAKRLGIVSGFGDGMFRPGQDVTAGQAAKIMVNALKNQQFNDLQQALDYVEARKLFRQRYTLNQPLKRNEAAERIFKLSSPEDSVPESDQASLDQGPPRYVVYDAEEYTALKGKKPLILFFHAPWCPLCRASDAAITAALGDLKGEITWYKVDYDTELALRKEFKITYQDTFIVLDASGKEVKRVNGVKSKDAAQALLDAALAE